MAHRDARRTLVAEHDLLGATFDDQGRVSAYACERRDAPALLADVTHVSVQLLSGNAATPLVRAAFAGPTLEVGTLSWQVALTGDGALASVALVARTGEREYVVLDPSERAELLATWLGFLQGIEQEGFAPYADMQVEDVTAGHVCLLLRGLEAPAILSDYLGGQALPEVGTLGQLLLDRIPAIVMALPGTATPAYLLMVAPHDARVLWRSLLSFPELSPQGNESLAAAMAEELPWTAHLVAGERVTLPRAKLDQWGLLRAERDFVGARSLTE